MNYICEHCKKKFMTKSSLNVHIKSAKKCLMSRGEIIVKSFSCEYCNFSTTIKSSLDGHIKTCRGVKSPLLTDTVLSNKELRLQIEELKKNHISEMAKYDLQIKNLEETIKDKDLEIHNKTKDIIKLKSEVKEYKTSIIKIAEKPKISNNNNNNQRTTNNTQINLAPLDLDVKTIATIIQNNFELKHISIKGVVDFITEHITKPVDGISTYICSDPSRNVFKFKDTDGKIKKDLQATKLIDAIKEPIRNRSTQLGTPEQSRLLDRSSDELNTYERELISRQFDELTNNIVAVRNLEDNRTELSKELAIKTTV